MADENQKIFDTIEELSQSEQIRLFNGNGSWQTFSAGGKVPAFFMSDGPHGLRKQSEEKYADLNNSETATCFPTASCIASSWNRNALEEMGKAIACEAVKSNVQLMLGPGVNVKRSPLCGRNFEYFSEDPFLAGTLAASYINGMQKNGAGSCIKHFACNNQEKYRQISNSIVDERTLNEIYLKPFRIAVKNSRPAAIMTSYNLVNGEYSCKNKYLLNDILRKKWEYDGLVISDWGGCMNAPECVEAGLNLSMPDSYGYFTEEISKALASGSLSEDCLKTANYYLIKTADRLIRLSQNARNNQNEPVDYSKQHETALKLALDSAVLLKNDGILPISKQKITVIGELSEKMKFQGGGSSHITTKNYPNSLEAFAQEGFEVYYAKGYFSGFCAKNKLIKKNQPLFKEALELAQKAAAEKMPVLFFTGLTETYEGEGFDRENLNLPEEQLTLLNKILEITQNIVVVNFSGAPVYFPFADRVRGILQMYLCGEGCGKAVEELISGKANPCGKLAESFPYKTDDIPCREHFGGENLNVEYREGIFTGYRHYQSRNVPVQFPFGFGLSYTTFEYKNLNVKDPFHLSLDITNTGNVDGSEIVEIYVKNPEINVTKGDRPLLELRGFEKVFLKAGQTKTAEISLDPESYSIYSPVKKDFIQIAGKYTIMAGACINDLQLCADVNTEGPVTANNLEQLLIPVTDEFFRSKSITQHGKGEFTVSDCLGRMGEASLLIRIILKLAEKILILTNKSKSKEDPAVKIELSAIRENPLESLISVSNGLIKPDFARKLVKKANK